MHLACSMGNNEIINILLDNAECDFRLKNLNEETCLDLLWMAMLKEPKYLSLELINRFIMQGALFSAPWNFTFAPHCHVPFVKLMSTACKYRLKDLFISQDTVFGDYIINGKFSVFINVYLILNSVLKTNCTILKYKNISEKTYCFAIKTTKR